MKKGERQTQKQMKVNLDVQKVAKKKHSHMSYLGNMSGLSPTLKVTTTMWIHLGDIIVWYDKNNEGYIQSLIQVNFADS